MKAIKMDTSGCVFIQSESLWVWVDVFSQNGELTADWNKYIFDLSNSKDLQVKAFQEDADNASEAFNLAIDYYEKNIKKVKASAIKKLASEMISESTGEMLKKLDRVLESGCVDIDGWDESNAPMVLPKSIIAAILQSESFQYEGRGTSYEKRIKKEIKNIRYFI